MKITIVFVFDSVYSFDTIRILRGIKRMRFSISNRDDDNSKQLNNIITDILIQNDWIRDDSFPNIVICIGGDGTILRAIHDYINILDSTSFVGLHTGTLGFLTDYVQDELDDFIHDLLNNSPDIEERPLLEVHFSDDSMIYAFNEIRIEKIFGTLDLKIYIDGEFFEATRGSGICVSTQAGSSAMNRALSGAVIDSGINVLQLCEIMPITNKTHHSLRNPYIMHEDREIVVRGNLKNVHAGYDHLDRKLEDIDEILINTSQKKARFARYRTYSYLERLKNIY